MSTKCMVYFPATIFITFTFCYAAISTIDRVAFPNSEVLTNGQERLKAHWEQKGTVWCQLACKEENSTEKGLHEETEVEGNGDVGQMQTLECSCGSSSSDTYPTTLKQLSWSWLGKNETLYVIPAQYKLYVLKPITQGEPKKLIFKGFVDMDLSPTVDATWPMQSRIRYHDYGTNGWTMYNGMPEREK